MNCFQSIAHGPRESRTTNYQSTEKSPFYNVGSKGDKEKNAKLLDKIKSTASPQVMANYNKVKNK
jgi:hypothetical protein